MQVVLGAVRTFVKEMQAGGPIKGASDSPVSPALVSSATPAKEQVLAGGICMALPCCNMDNSVEECRMSLQLRCISSMAVLASISGRGCYVSHLSLMSYLLME